MKFFKIFSTLLICILLFGLTPVVDADGPDDEHAPDTLPPVTDSTDQGSMFVLDPATAHISRLGVADEGQPAAPAAPLVVVPPTTSRSLPTVKGVKVDGSFEFVAEFNKEAGTFNVIPDSANTVNVVPLGPRKPATIPGSRAIGASASTLIIDNEGGEGAFPPAGPWSQLSNAGVYWDDVDCYPVESGGVRSIWATDDFIGNTPCLENYPANVAIGSWLIYGPFDLSDAQSAFLDFFFRLDTEPGDGLRWGASVDGSLFYGPSAISGDFENGPYQNNYNLASFNLASVPGLGDVTGQPNVWITFYFFTDGDANVGKGAYIDGITLRKNSDKAIYLTNEPFNDTGFPNATWLATDYGGSGYLWDDVHTFQGPNCPVHTATGAMWPADVGVPDLDPCGTPPDDYANNMFSWLEHGPFSLAGASEGWIDFYTRYDIETCCDYLFWGVSVDGNQYWGTFASGTLEQGPFGNGYYLRRLDLSNVPSLGNILGQPEVWLAFVMGSDGSIRGRGPFVDDVMVVVEKNIGGTVYMPIIHKPPPPKVTTLKVQNGTSKNMTFTVKNARLNQKSIGDLACGTITPGQNKTCGQIDTGEYTATAGTTACASSTKLISISNVPVHQVNVKCVSS